MKLLSLSSIVFKSALCSVLISGCATAIKVPPFNENSVDNVVERAMTTFNIPGVAVGVIKDGKVLLNRGYGVQDINNNLAIDEHTLFKIASTTKAFTAAALAMLVDQQKLNWDSKVVEFIPEFALYDPWVTKEFTIADLLTHRSGLARFAGDLMLWPEPAGFSRQEIINNLKHLKPASGFRSEYAYDNLLYIVAGEVVAKVTDKSWEDFIEQEIFKPLGMKRCYAGAVPKTDLVNIAQPHSITDGKVTIVERNQTYHKESVMAAAGGIKCSISDLLTWVDLQLNQGTSTNALNQQTLSLFSVKQSEIMWSPHTILSSSQSAKEEDNTNLRAYGLGWRIADYHGVKNVSHTGSLSGNLAYITLIPEIDLGVVVLMNQNAYGAREAIMKTIVNSFLPVEQKDWIAINLLKQQQRQAEQLAKQRTGYSVKTNVKPEAGQVNKAIESYIGQFEDIWFGQVKISASKGKLSFESVKSVKLKGELIPQQNNQFMVFFDDRSLEADAFVNFLIDDNGEVNGFTMERATEEVDLSFDWHDLSFKKLHLN